MDRIAENRVSNGEIENKHQVCALGDDDFGVAVEVQQLGGRGREEIELLFKSHQFAVEVREPCVFQLRIIHERPLAAAIVE